MIQTSRAFSVAKPICIIFIALFCIILSSCGRHPAEVLPEPVITRGTWHDHIYVNEFMGFQFELPETWFVYTEEERAVFINSISGSVYELYGEMPPPETAFDMQDMRAEDFITGSSVSIDVQILTADVGVSNEYEYLQKMRLYMPGSMGIAHSNIHIGAYPRHLGKTGWYYMSSNFTDTFGRSGIQVRFINIQGKFLRTILISVASDEFQVADEIWERFSEIDTEFHNTEGVIPTMHNAPSVISRGFWEENKYINPSLNLRFTRPSHFGFFSDGDLAASINVPVSLLYGDTIGAELWGEAIRNSNTIHLMSTYGAVNNGHVFVDLYARSIPRGMRNYPTQKYLQHLLNHEILMWQDGGGDVRNITLPVNTKEIAGHQWYTGNFTVSLFDDCSDYCVRVDIFITVVDNHVWRLQIETSDGVLEETLAMFSVGNY